MDLGAAVMLPDESRRGHDPGRRALASDHGARAGEGGRGSPSAESARQQRISWSGEHTADCTMPNR